MKSRISNAQYLLLFLLPTLITAGWVLAMLKESPAILRFLGMMFSVLAWRSFMMIPFEFEVISDTIQFRAVLRKVSIRMDDVREIDTQAWNRGFVVFRVSNATIFLFRRMPNLKNLVETVTNFNHVVRIKGSL